MERRTVRREEAAQRFDEAARETYMAAVDRAFDVQKGGVKLSRTFFQNWMETLEEGVEINRRSLEGLQRIAEEHRELFFELSQDSLNSYDAFVDSLAAYEAETMGRRGPDRQT